MKTVYWTRFLPTLEQTIQNSGSPDSYLSPLLLEPPIPLLKHISKDFFGPAAGKCPAIVNDIKNTFVIKSPIDITLKINPSGIEFHNINPELGKQFIGPPQGASFIHQLGFAYLFFTNFNCTAVQLPAYYDNNDFVNKTTVFSGSFDIGSWFRPAGKPAFKFKKQIDTIQIKKGDPVMYVRFLCDEKLKLQEFELDNNLQRMTSETTSIKFAFSNILNLEKCYEIFHSFKMRQKVVKQIKQNII